MSLLMDTKLEAYMMEVSSLRLLSLEPAVENIDTQPKSRHDYTLVVAKVDALLDEPDVNSTMQ